MHDVKNAQRSFNISGWKDSFMAYFQTCSYVDFARGLATMVLGIYAFMSGAFFLGALSLVLMMSIRQDFRQWLQSKLPDFSASRFFVLRGVHRLISGFGAFLPSSIDISPAPASTSNFETPSVKNI